MYKMNNFNEDLDKKTSGRRGTTGTKWITNGKKNKLIQREDMEKWSKEGKWYVGRIINGATLSSIIHNNKKRIDYNIDCYNFNASILIPWKNQINANDVVFYVYKTTNTINNKIYIGVRGSKNINTDLYMGSGKLINKAIKKYGNGNFKREILYEFITEKEAYDKEFELVNINFIKKGNTYNINIGGYGGFTSHSEKTKQKMKNSARGAHVGNKNSQYGTKWVWDPKTGETKKITKKLVDEYLSKNTNWEFGRPRHTAKTKQKISNSMMRRNAIKK